MSKHVHNWTTQQWVESDRKHHMHPFTNYGSFEKEDSRIVTKADNIYIWDSEGNRIMDGMAGLWCVNVGYGRTEIVDAACAQMRELPYYNTFFKSSTMPPVELAEVLSEITPKDLNHAFFANSGSEANDTVVRMVRHFWNLEGKPKKKNFIGREYGYHGSTMASISLGGMSGMHAQADLPLPGFHHVMPPYKYLYGADMTEDAFAEKAAQAVEDKILELGADTVAAFIGEPIQGAGGVIVPPAGYWPRIEAICRKHDILLIVDEVICGFGRTGNWFGSDTYGITPDLMPIAKGLTSGYLPLSAVMVNDRVHAVLRDKSGEFVHGFTYSGHPASCAAALANIEIFKRDKLIEQVGTDTGPYFQKLLRDTFTDHPIVGDVRGVGLVAAIELVKNKSPRETFPDEGTVGTRCRDISVAGGLMMRATRDSMILSPPLVITREQIDELVAIAKSAIDQTAREMGMM